MNNPKKNIQHKGINPVVKPKQQAAGKKSPLNSRDMTIALLAGVSVITFICFNYTLHNQFLNWDDWIYITKDPAITGFTASHLNSLLFRNITENYFHPLTMLSLAVNYRFSQLNPEGYYFTNILLHILNAIIVFYFIRMLMEAMIKSGYKSIPAIPWIVAIGALLHGIHPMHVESVAWIAERKDVMYSIFYLAGLMMYIRYTEGAKFKWMLYVNACLALFCLWGVIALKDFSLDFTLKGQAFSIGDSAMLGFFFLLLAATILIELKFRKIKVELFYVLEFFLFSLLSKPLAVSFPLSLIALDFLLKRDLKFISPGGGTVSRYGKVLFHLAKEKWMFFLVSVLSGIQSLFLQSETNTLAFTNGYSIIQKLLISCYTFTMYTVKAFFPVNLNSFYPFPSLTSDHFLPPVFYLAPLFAAAIIIIPLYLTRKNNDLFRVVLFGLGFYFVNLVFILQFLSDGTTLMSERYSYVSYFGLIFIFIYVAHLYWYKNKSYHNTILGAAAVICLIFFYLSYERTKVWHNPETLWTDAIAKDGTSAQLPMLNLGIYYADSGKYEKAYTEFVTLTKLNTKEPLVYRKLGTIYGMKKQYDSALYCFGVALKYDSGHSSVYNNRGITYASLGKFDLALKDFKKAYSFDTTQNDVLAEMASSFTQMGRYNEAVTEYSKLIEREPKEPSNYVSRGTAWLHAGNPAMAAADYRKLLELQPGNGEYMYYLSYACREMNNKPDAVKYATMAQKAGYAVPDDYLKTLQ